ncbi:FRG domain-containing protein [Pedobacter sp. 22226]|uniref:FRG domain-containing protein n=1 Tax=Pedobacter sp. 22226 TaxID=3453894 RepID=UPI003F846DF8
MQGYWKYYDPKFDWKTRSSILNADLKSTIRMLQEQGFSAEESLKIFNSGYVGFENEDIIVDRFYGGAFSSYDNITRFSITGIKNNILRPPSSRIKVQKVKSFDDLKVVIANSDYTNGKVVFRGQNQNYFVNREINNPYYTIEDYGEISLLPSIWRRMYEVNPQSFTDFSTLSLLEWTNIFYSAFDLDEIEKRHKQLIEEGESIFTMSEMEDCSDKLLREFGKFRLDISMGMNHNLATKLTTLLQHYGLYSPVLDLTESLEVAIFFATHKYERKAPYSTYQFIGSNNRQSVIYLLRFDRREMERHDERDNFLKYLEPQRPIKQKCVICQSDQYAINRPACFIEKVLVLDFDIEKNISGITAEDIFPNHKVDKFLNAIYDKSFNKEMITRF